MIKIIGFIFIVVLVPSNAGAHSGGTNAEGCHTNRKTGDTHCHNKKLKSPKTQNTSEVGNRANSPIDKPSPPKNKNRIFQWVDEKGEIHYSKEIKDLPKNINEPKISE